MGFWDFHETADGYFQWRYLSDTTADCVYSGRFRSRNDCIADAMRHGYLSGTTPFEAITSGNPARPNGKDLQGEAAAPAFLARLFTL